MIHFSYRYVLSIKIDSLRLLSRVGILATLLSYVFITIISFTHLKTLPFCIIERLCGAKGVVGNKLFWRIMTLFLLLWFIWSISMLKTDFKQKSTMLLMVLFSLHLYSVVQICFATSNLHGYSKKPHHDLLPISIKYQGYDFICAVCAYFWGKCMMSKQYMKGRYIFQALFVYYIIYLFTVIS